ncbi:MAG: radical SAM protein [Clostridiales bacterium]|jgi:uncharacterized protein|nr:radical SAM protein [Clostridiales bacterium]
MLVLTEACNLDCVYCYEAHKSGRGMETETALGILQSEIARAADGLDIVLMGGEPLLRFETIRILCDFGLESGRCRFEIPTNGTLLTEEMRRYFAGRRGGIKLSLSADGLGEMHRKNRGGPAADLGFFVENWPGAPVRATIWPDTAALLAESILPLHERRMPVAVHLADGVVWGHQACEALRDGMRALTEYYLRNPDVRPVSSLYSPAFWEHLAYGMPCNIPESCCPPGSSRAVYDVDGRVYPCHMLLPVAAGERAERFAGCDSCVPDGMIEDGRCLRCRLRGICENCMGVNLLVAGDVRRCVKHELQCEATWVRAAEALRWFALGVERRIRAGDAVSAADVRAARRAIDFLSTNP